MMTDRDVLDLEGRPRRLKDFRRRSHVLIFRDPAADLAAWRRDRLAEKNRWIWLQAELVTAEDVEPGIHFVSRWGDLVQVFPPSPWDSARLEEEILRWDDRDCCDLTSAP